MSETPLTTMLSRVRDQYNSDVRWKYLVVILLLLIHLLTVGPFIELSREKSKSESEIKRLSQVKSKIEDLAFKDLNTSVSDNLDGQLEKFVNNLISDFKRLDLTVQNLREKAKTESALLPKHIKSLIPSDIRENHASILEARKLLEELKSKDENPATESGLSREANKNLETMLNSSEFRESVDSATAEWLQRSLHKVPDGRLQVQSSEDVEEILPFHITGSDLLKKIKLSKKNNELREALKPFVEANIIEPRYDKLNQYWKTNLLPDIQRQCEALENDANTAEIKCLGIDKKWGELAGAFEAIRLAAGNLEFEQHTESGLWWSSIEQKEGARSDLKKKVMDELKEPAVLTSFRDQVTQLFEEQEGLARETERDLSERNEQFQDQVDKLASIAKPLRFLALELESVMGIFPLLIGLVLAGATAWTTLRLRELGWTIHLMVKEGADQLLWDWYSAQVFLLLPKSSSTMNDRHNSSLIRKSLGLCALSWIWIGIAAWRLCGIGDTSPIRLVVVTCIGAAVAALAQAYHYVVINSILSLKPEQAASVATSSQG